jgi:hypothetical protein
MAKTSGLGDNFYVGGYDISGDVGSIDQISTPTATFDVTSIKDYANERIFGRRDADVQFTSFFEYSGTATTPAVPATTVPYKSTVLVPVLVKVIGGTVTGVSVNGSSVGTGDGAYLLPALGTITLTYSSAPTWTWAAVGTEHDVLSMLPRTDVIATYLRGTTLLNPAFCVSGVQLNYDPTRDASGNLTLKVEIQGDKYGGEWGVQLTPGTRTDTAATTGTAVDDNGAGTAYGAQAYLQLLEFDGTSVDVTVQASTTSGGTYATVIDFGSQTAIGAVRAVALGSVPRYLKVVTAGTFDYAAFNVVWVRNQSQAQF